MGVEPPLVVVTMTSPASPCERRDDMRSTEMLLASIAVLGGTAMMGCGGGNDTPDAAMVAMDDAATASQPRAAIGDRTTNMPANFGCVGSNTAPTAGDPVAGTVTFTALALSPFPVAMGDVEVFPGATVGAAGSGMAGTTAADGTFGVTLPAGGWFGYRMAAAGTGSTASVPVVGHFYTGGDAAGGNVGVTAISSSVADIIAGQLNRELTTDTAAVSGSVRDCDTEETANIQIRFFRGDTEIVSGPASDVTSPRITGLGDGAIPSATSSGLTAYFGRFGGIVPSAGGAVRIEAWGVIEDGGAPTLVGCEEVLVEPATITVAVIPALRNDYPAGSGCAGR